MSNTNGGPAFPSMRDMRFNPDFDHEEGMSLRVYFAAHAPLEVADANKAFARSYLRNPSTLEMLSELVDLRVAYADAMLKALKLGS